MSPYAIGFDCDAESVRTIAVDIRDGRILESPTGRPVGIGVAIADGVTPDLDLPAGVPVATIHRDYAVVAGAGVVSPSTMVIDVATGVHLMNSRIMADVPDVTRVDRGFLPGYLGYDIRHAPLGQGRPAIEAAAFALANTCDAMRDVGVPVRRFVAIGAARNDPQIMQIFADVLAEKIAIAASDEPALLGAAVHGCLAAGSTITGHAAMSVAVQAMAHQRHDVVYRPDIDARRTYAKLRSGLMPPRSQP